LGQGYALPTELLSQYFHHKADLIVAKVRFTSNLWGKVMLYQLSYFRNNYPKRLLDNGDKDKEKK